MNATYRTLIGGEWLATGKSLDVIDKFSGETFATVPVVDRDITAKAIECAAKAFASFRRVPAHHRAKILEKVSDQLLFKSEAIADTIAREAGKAWKYAMNEVQRSSETFKFAAEEAKRSNGELLPMDASRFGENRIGYFLREPIGVIGAITPFNFPLNLVAHKVAPALAAGNTLVLKPASSTPVSAILLAEILAEAGLPPGVLNVTIGSGTTVGDTIVTHPECRKITFTGSVAVGEQIIKKAGIKKVTLELGNNSAVIIEADADLAKAASRCVVSAFANSGQVCISLQRIYVHKKVIDRFTGMFLENVRALKVGNPLDRDCDVGPMIDRKELERVDGWVREAVAQGATVAAGGRAEGTVYLPTVLTGVREDMKVMCGEVFGPVVSIVPYEDLSEALARVNASDFGLQAGLYTSDLNLALSAVDALETGGVMINDTPTFRVDQMPYGGNRHSGLGREGVRFAMEEMTNIKTVVINRN